MGVAEEEQVSLRVALRCLYYLTPSRKENAGVMPLAPPVQFKGEGIG